jgi:hypothetical protein
MGAGLWVFAHRLSESLGRFNALSVGLTPIIEFATLLFTRTRLKPWSVVPMAADPMSASRPNFMSI